jgi:hypothetical protein
MSKLYCPFRCEFDKPNYGANGNELWVPTCPECDAPLQTISQLTTRALECGYACGWADPFGFVPEDGCPVHDPEPPQPVTPVR